MPDHKDTTGTRVMYFSNSVTSVKAGTDAGFYDGTIPEHNCRVLRSLKSFKHLSVSHPAVQAIVNRGEGYGCSWGDPSMLFPITAEDEAALTQLNAEAAAEEEKRRREALRDEPKEWRSPRGLTLSEEMDRDDSIY